MSTLKLIFRTLDKHVCDLKWAKRLKEIGIRQDTYFQWLYDAKNDKWDVAWYDFCDEDEIHCAAFTAQDFIEIFPKLFKVARNLNKWLFYCEYADMDLPNEDNLANVFARILIAITKNKKEQKRIDHD